MAPEDLETETKKVATSSPRVQAVDMFGAIADLLCLGSVWP